MLVLSRKVDEALVMTGGIRVVVLDVEGDRVELGIEAPRSCVVLREELQSEGAERGERDQRSA